MCHLLFAGYQQINGGQTIPFIELGEENSVLKK